MDTKKPGYRGSRAVAFGADNGARTRDPNLGKVVLYQLSYFRNCECKDSFTFRFMQMVYYFFSSNKLLQNN